MTFSIGNRDVVGRQALRIAGMRVPVGFYAVDRNALQAARQGVPTGEYHAA